jgi:hypothetical protein
MKTITVLFAGAMLTSAAFALTSDSGAEERFRMKYGRSTPATEAQQKKTSHHMNCMGHCSQMNHEVAAYGPPRCPGTMRRTGSVPSSGAFREPMPAYPQLLSRLTGRLEQRLREAIPEMKIASK